MRYRVRARRAKASRHVLSLDLLQRDGWTREEYVALRDELIRMFGDRLDGVEPFWTHEPGVPDRLRALPEMGDPRLLAVGGPENVAQFELDETAHEAILAGRRAWLDEHLADEEMR